MNRRILVVDDSAAIRDQLQPPLLEQKDGIEVSTASDAADGCSSLPRSRPFQLLITDLRMPDMGGLDLLAAARAERMPFGVIVLTGHGDAAVALEAMKAGADDFVTKPFEPGAASASSCIGFSNAGSLIDELEGLRASASGGIQLSQYRARRARRCARSSTSSSTWARSARRC